MRPLILGFVFCHCVLPLCNAIIFCRCVLLLCFATCRQPSSTPQSAGFRLCAVSLNLHVNCQFAALSMVINPKPSALNPKA